jgi:hypothetical protein
MDARGAAEGRLTDEFGVERRSWLAETSSTEDGMDTVTSADGTRIAYDRYDDGRSRIVINSALGYRKFKKFEEIAKVLSQHCTVVNCTSCATRSGYLEEMVAVIPQLPMFKRFAVAGSTAVAV